MNKTKQSFRLAVIRRRIQANLFDEAGRTEKITVIAANRTKGIERLVQWWYNHRIQSNERIKKIKIVFDLERMPCGQFKANAVFFRIGVLAHDLGRLFVLKTMYSSCYRHHVQMLRWKL